MGSRNSAGGICKHQLAQFIFEGRECHGSDLDALDINVSALLMRLSFVVLRCKDQLAHASIELRIRIVLRDGVAAVSEIENWSKLPAGLQQRLGIEPELFHTETALRIQHAA